MNAIANTNTSIRTETPQRRVIYRNEGRTRGGVTRFVSPGDAGKLIKPFVFLDLFQLESSRHKMGMHPHSGIATVTVILNGALEYRETTGSEGVLPVGGVEWMRAGGGVWHEGGPVNGGSVDGFQLWLALPPEDENGPSESLYLAPDKVQRHGPVRVIIGQYGDATSPIRPRASMNYLHVSLKAGECWTYQPPTDHTVAWVAVGKGILDTTDKRIGREVAVFEEGNEAIHFEAQVDTEFVLGSAVKHPHDLITGYYSVHTSHEALVKGEQEIERIGADLQMAAAL